MERSSRVLERSLYRDGDRDGNGGNVPSATQTGAARLTGKDAVKLYVEVRDAAGVGTPRTMRQVLGYWARQVVAEGRWDDDTIREAIRVCGPSTRHPRFLGEWCATVFNAQGAKAHQNQKAEEIRQQQNRIDKPLHRPNWNILASLSAPAVPSGKETPSDGSFLSNSRGNRG